jgi:hypothetical protein
MQRLLNQVPINNIIYQEMKIPWRAANEGPPVPEEQYQERFWRRRLELDWTRQLKSFWPLNCERNYVERKTAVAQELYKSLLAGLQSVGQVKGCSGA